ncbi:MAG TPA: PAS domain S-box protein [Pirellulales bacterium]|jgi:PAS domain S-box-containing protein|nr:PAS domain S-box protein [Pirellulales bacterium]
MKRRSKAASSNSQLNQMDFVEFLDRLPAGAYICDPEGKITYFNRPAAEVWGREPKLNDPADRFCGSFRLLAADETPLRHEECWMALALQTGQEYHREEIIVERPDGSRRNVLAHASPIRDSSGKITGAINIVIDLSDQKQADRNSAILASLVASSDDAIVSKTLDGRILTWNGGAERIFGFTAEEAIGSQITIIIPPERLDEERFILERLRNGERIEHFETERLTKAGHRVDISLTVSPLRDRDGRIFGASKIARDITARKRDEADLRRLHEMSRRLSATRELDFVLEEILHSAMAIEETDLGLLSLYDPEQRRLAVAASHGFDDEFLESLERLGPIDDLHGSSFRERRRHVVEDMETDPVDAGHRDVARQAGYRAIHSTPLIARSGEIVGVLSTHFREPHQPTERVKRLIDLCAHQAVDFVENARLFEQLRLADRRKDEFLATLAHELRNPLAPICNAIDILKLSDDLDPAVEHVRNIMERQVTHMVRLVDDLLEVSRIARGKSELRKEIVELSAILASAVETSRPYIEAAGHQLVVSISPSPITVNADATRLVQVVVNLLNNAAKYMDRSGQIWLTAQHKENEVVLSVRDSGLGIPPDMLLRVFDMYAQVDSHASHSRGGLGLGLPLAKHLVEMHGGRIEARSDGTGAGSEFIIHLPLAVRPMTPIARDESIPLPTRRILIVDDAQAAIYVLGKLLEKMGQDVCAAQDSASALELAKSQRPDIVISDIGMPNMDGCELARQLRKEPGLEGVILVALTGYEQDDDRRQTKDAGFDYHLVKPVSLAALEQLLANVPIRPTAIPTDG